MPATLTDPRRTVQNVHYRDASDDALVALAQKGHGLAFRTLIERHWRRAERTAARHLQDRSQAADVAQEAFLSLSRALPRYEGRGRFAAYMARVVRNHCLMLNRQNRRFVPLEEDHERPGQIHQLRQDGAIAIRQLLAGVSAEERHLLGLRFAEGLLHREIAAQQGLPEGTVRRKFAELLSALAKSLACPDSARRCNASCPG